MAPDIDAPLNSLCARCFLGTKGVFSLMVTWVCLFLCLLEEDLCFLVSCCCGGEDGEIVMECVFLEVKLVCVFVYKRKVFLKEEIYVKRSYHRVAGQKVMMWKMVFLFVLL